MKRRSLVIVAACLTVLVGSLAVLKRGEAQIESDGTLILRGHTGTLEAAGFLDDGNHVITESQNKTLHIWNATTGKQVAVLQRPGEYLRIMKFSADYQRILAQSDDGIVCIWDAKNGKKLAAIRVHSYKDGNTGWHWEARRNLFAFSPDGNRFLITSSESYSSDGTEALSSNKISKLWNTADGKAVATLGSHKNFIRSAHFSPDSTRIVTTAEGNANVALVLNAADGKELLTLRGHTAEVIDAVFSPDGKLILTESWDNMPRLWDAATGKELAVLTGGPLKEILWGPSKFSPDGKRVFTGDRGEMGEPWGGRAKAVRLWDVATGKEIAALRGHDSNIFSVLFSPDSSRIVTRSSDRTHIRDAATGEEIVMLSKSEHLFDDAFSPDSTRFKTLYYTRDARKIRIRNTADGKEIATLPDPYPGIISPDLKRFITTNDKDNSIHLWDIDTGKELAVLQGHTGKVLHAAFSPDGKRVVTASDDRTARIWNIK